MKAVEGRALLRYIQYNNGCRLKGGGFHRRKRPVSENPCPPHCGCVIEAEAIIEEQRAEELAVMTLAPEQE
jgi:hypothetical protein